MELVRKTKHLGRLPVVNFAAVRGPFSLPSLFPGRFQLLSAPRLVPCAAVLDGVASLSSRGRCTTLESPHPLIMQVFALI